ncbi:MAG: beta-propeller fold lactonase family protein [Firmicutes bacterium]|nr:beta-propeller fold lactonase family protein [Bacillota bacterium]
MFFIRNRHRTAISLCLVLLMACSLPGALTLAEGETPSINPPSVSQAVYGQEPDPGQFPGSPAVTTPSPETDGPVQLPSVPEQQNGSQDNNPTGGQEPGTGSTQSPTSEQPPSGSEPPANPDPVQAPAEKPSTENEIMEPAPNPTNPTPTFTLLNAQALLTDFSITTSELSPAVVGKPYSMYLNSANGIAPYNWSIVSGAPAWLSCSASTGELTGTPTEAGTYPLEIQVIDGSTPANSATSTLTLTVNTALEISTTSIPEGAVGMPYSATVTATGGVAPYHWTLPAIVPDWLTIDPDTGVISGTPTDYYFSFIAVRVFDSSGSGSTPAAYADKWLDLHIYDDPVAATPRMLESGSLNGSTVNLALIGTEFNTPTLAAGDFVLINPPAGLSVAEAVYSDPTHCSIRLAYSGGTLPVNDTDFRIQVKASAVTAGIDLNSNIVVITAPMDAARQGVTAGNTPTRAAVNPVTGLAYVTNLMNRTITIIDTGNNPTQLNTNQRRPFSVGINPNTNRVYVANKVENTVSVLGGSTGTVLSTITLGAGDPSNDIRDLVVNPDTDKVYIAHYTAKKLIVINGADNTFKTISLPDAPSAIALNRATNRVYVCMPEVSVHQMTVINGADDSVITTLDVDYYPNSLAVNPSTNRVYVTSSTGNKVQVIDGATNTIINEIPVDIYPVDTAVNENTNRVYVANLQSYTVSVINGDDSSVVSIPMPGKPMDLVVNPTSNRVYVTGTDTNQLTEIRGSDNTSTSITVGASPASLAVNPVNGRVYVPDGSGCSVIMPNVPVVVPDTPTISPNGGDFTNGVQVTITGSGGTVYYTTDGSDPTDGTGIEYNGPFTLAASATVKAAVQNDSSWSGVTSAVFTVNVQATTLVLSNEEGGLIDNLIAAGYGNKSLFDALVSLQEASGGVITDDFLETLALNDASSPILTQMLNSYTGLNGAIAINTDGTVFTMTSVKGRDYHGQSGYSTYPEGGAIELFTYADSAEYYIDAESGGTTYKAFAIAWSSGVKVAGAATDSSVTMTPGGNSVSTDNTWEIDVTAGTLKGAAGDDLTGDISMTGLPTGLNWTARNNGTNKILVTVNGSADPAVTARTTVSVVVRGSAVSGAGATDSDAVSLYVHPARRYPIALAVNQNTNTVYTANKGSLDVTVIDGATDTVAATISAGTYPSAIAVNPDTNKIYVTNQHDKTVLVIDGATNAVIATLPTGTYPVDLTVNRAANKVYVANNSSKNVTVIDGATDTVLGTVTAGNSPYDLSVNQNTNRVYTANYYDKTVSVIDGATNTLITNVTSDTGPYAVALNQTTNKVYVTNLKNIITNENGTVTVIDGATHTVSNSITVGVKPRAIAVNPATNRVYVANLDNDSVMVIDGATDTITATVTVGDGPLALGINQNTDKIYVANCGDDTVTVIDGTTNSTGSVAAGDYPCIVAVNETSGKAYIANQYSDFLTIIASPPPVPPAAPTIDPNGGTFTDSVQVAITGSAGTTYYTIDGSDPTGGTGIEYTGPFTLTSSATVKAAVQSGSVWSEVATAVFTIYTSPNLPAAPTISPNGGTFTDSVQVAITGSGGTIYYTTDGSDPTSSGTRTGYAVPFSLTQSVTVKAAVHGESSGWSGITQADFTIVHSSPSAPVIDPNGGIFTGSVQVAITGSGGTTYYTIDGSNPTGGTGIEYTGPFSLSQSATVKAAVHGESSGWSGITQADFTIVHSPPSAPVIAPNGGTFINSVQVAITGSGGTIYYTIDGSDPTGGTGIEYTGPFTLTSSATVKAAVHGESSGWSGITRADFTIVHSPPSAPVIAPNGGIFINSVQVAITGSGGTIYYTIDGSDPTGGTGIEYTGQFTLTQSATVKAAVHGEYGWSEVSSADFTINISSTPLKIAGVATDSSVTMASGNTAISGNDSTWKIELTAGTMKGATGDALTVEDLTVAGLPAGLDWTAKNNGSNKILITVSGTAASAITAKTTVSLVIKSGTVSESGATDSDAISVYVNPYTGGGNAPGGGGGGTPEPENEPETVKPTTEPEVKTPTVEEPGDLAGHWAHDCAMALLQHGLIKGYPDGTIRPDNEITRAEAAALLVSALGLNDYQPRSMENPYQDEIPPWAKKAVLTAAEKGLMKGYPDGTFRPGQEITRAEMCAALMQAFPRVTPAGFVLDFTDNDSIPDWAKQFIQTAVANGVVSGYPDRTFQPDSSIKRGEVFSIICRLMGYHQGHGR